MRPDAGSPAVGDLVRVRETSPRLLPMATDIGLLLGTTLLSQLIRFGTDKNGVQLGFAGVDYTTFSVLLTIVWAIALLVQRGGSSDDLLLKSANGYRDIWRATLIVVVGLAIYSSVAQLQMSRGYLLVAIPLGLLALTGNRVFWRRWMIRQRAAGKYSLRTVLVGSDSSVRRLTDILSRDSSSGMRVVGYVVTTEESRVEGSWAEESRVDESRSDRATDPATRILRSGAEVQGLVRDFRADAVVVIGDAGRGDDFVRELSWALEGSGIRLMVSPSVGPVAGARLHTIPVAGHQMIYVQEPQYSGTKYLAKRALDIGASAAGLILLSPLFLTLAVVIRLDSPGPAFFRQTRSGRGGALFSILKFRTMVQDAEALRSALAERNEHSGPMFKIRADPRITRVGSVLRRYSLDELPQLLNVLLGHMSLVGPRPPLPAEVEAYASRAHRRLLLKPGLTGPWQISGRSDLGWEEGLFLDLYYVENWSLFDDILILGRTVGAVLRSQGAY
jgi:exopolysaccharide biosynthesis polyprenyl glycosylphosphotransferase